MTKTIFGCLGAAAVAFALQFTPANVEAGLFERCTPCAEVDCYPCDDAGNCDPCDAVCGPKAKKWFVNGHLEAGFFANGHGQKSTYDGYGGLHGRGADYWSGNTELLQNTRLTGAQINQVYVSMGRAVDGKRGLDIGGTVDFTWGADAYMVQAAGLELKENGLDKDRWGSGDYYSAFAQAYAELAYKRWNVKAGKFATPFGSSSYKSTDNFFYSWDPSALIVPHTAGGAYATYAVNNKLSVFGGWVMPDEIGQSSKYNCVLGGFNWTPSKRLNVRYAFAAGENTYTGYPFYDEVDVFVHTFGITSQINKRLKYVFDWTLLNVNAKDDSYRAAAYVLNNEIIYQYNKKWAFGTRFGMLNANDIATGYTGSNEGDWSYVSLGANWTPNKWLTVKPEVRYDWMDKTAQYDNPFNGGENTYQVSGGMSAVVKF